MSALDRAFIKAYGQRWRQPGDVARAAVVVQASGGPVGPTAIGVGQGRDPSEGPHMDRPLGLYASHSSTTDDLDLAPDSRREEVLETDAPQQPLSSADVRAARAQHATGRIVMRFDPPQPVGAAHDLSLSPLSSFTAGDEQENILQPLLEVDQFRWPLDVQRLCAIAGGALDEFVDQFAARRQTMGGRMFALAGNVRGAGRTTVALSLARRAAARDLTVVLLEADFVEPTIARRLGIQVTDGWEAVLGGQRSLAEVLISSRSDGLTIVPWRPSEVAEPPAKQSLRLSVIVGMLRASFDLVLIDAGVDSGPLLAELSALAPSARLDAVWLVNDERAETAAALAVYHQQLRAAGVVVAGTIANFSEPTSEVPAPGKYRLLNPN